MSHIFDTARALHFHRRPIKSREPALDRHQYSREPAAGQLCFCHGSLFQLYRTKMRGLAVVLAVCVAVVYSVSEVYFFRLLRALNKFEKRRCIGFN